MTTARFLFMFGFGFLRDLPEIEALEDAGLLDRASPIDDAHQPAHVADIDDEDDALDLAS